MKTFCAIVLSALICCQSAPAQEPSKQPAKDKSPYKALGAPANPKVPARWNIYHDYAESAKLLADLAKAHPEFAKLQSVGKTYGGREMWVLTVTNFAKGDSEKKPAMWIDGAIHANEIQATEVVLYTAWYLCEMRQDSDVVKRLLDERTFYLLPMMSPDSRDVHFYEPNSTHSPRSGQRPVDDDKDGLVDEDGPDDLDGDGSITMMRVKDKNGRFKPHPDFPSLMIQAKPGEKGEYRLLGVEGKDNDGDGLVNEDGDGFYDPNRDWGWNWQPDYIQNGAHRYPYSILENRFVADFIAAHAQIAGAQSYHNAGGMILRGPGAKDDAFDGSDLAVYDVIGKRGEQILPGYRYMNIANDLYEVYGGEVDWLHQVRGAWTFTNELFTPFNYFRTTGHEGFFGSSEVQESFNKYLLLDEGLAPWKEVEHPQYGKVEVGGMKKNWMRQPPSFLLEEECHRNMAFSLFHADELPLVKIQSVESKPLPGGITQVTAIIENPKTCPTHSTADIRRKLTPPDIVSLHSGDKELKVILGLTANEPFFREPAEQKREPSQMKLDTIPAHGIVYVRWLVSGKGPFEVRVESVKGGRDLRKGE
jgi:hypothetical protein